MFNGSTLNSNQLQAITHDGTVMVIAGPGTGKTKTLTAKIEYLIDTKNINPQEILALTFTQKAAAEMKERLGDLKFLPYISTFHALAFDILKNIHESIEIITEKEKEELLQQISKKNKISNRESKNLALFISQFKNNLNEESLAIISEYNQLLKEKNLIDYDDLLFKLYELLKENNEKVVPYKNKFTHILVDEFQDTNNLQYQIIKLLLKNNNLFVIGDPFQSIYSFRGATEEIVGIFKTDFPQSTCISLDTNYRSCREIIQASSALFPKKTILKANTDGTGEVAAIKTINEYTEGEYIVEMINKKIGGTDLLKAGAIQEEKRETRFSDFAVIYRTHAIGRIIEQTFINSGIPYQIVGGITIYEQPEVVFISNLLQYINQKDSSYLKDLLYSPIISLNLKSKLKISRLFSENKKQILTILEHSIDQYIDSRKDIHMISTIVDWLKDIVVKAKNSKLIPLIHIIMEYSLLTEYIAQKKSKDNYVRAFISTITQFNDKKNSIIQCCNYLKYLKEYEFYDPNCDKVTLLTLHAAKGLEFKYVFICGFEDGIIPFDRNNIDIEEEKRLLYVGMTRAKEGLYLLTALERNKKVSVISRFYSEMSEKLTILEDEAIIKQTKQIKKWKEKKSQLKLF